VEILDKDGKTQSENSGKASNETAKAGSVRQANGDKKASPAENKTLSTDERRALQSEVYMETHRLSRWLKQDQLANEAVSKNLQGAAVSEEQFGEMFEHDSAKLEKYVGVLRNISSELEGKLDGILKSKRLSAAQREQTPLQYREMVKSYYEQLSKQ
jgi:hypothetical protein